MKKFDKLALLVIKSRKVLFSRSKDHTVWYTPGGKREGTETDHESLQREIKEELGVAVDPNRLAFFKTYEAKAYGRDDIVRMICYRGELLGSPTPLSEIEELSWFGYKDRKKTTVVGKLILEDLKKQKLID